MVAMEKELVHPSSKATLRLHHDALVRISRLLKLNLDIPRYMANENCDYHWQDDLHAVSATEIIHAVCVEDRKHMSVEDLLVQRELDVNIVLHEMDQDEDMTASRKLQLREYLGLNDVASFLKTPPSTVRLLSTFVRI